MKSYYNEIDPYVAGWLRNLIAGGLIPPGDVDDRSIAEVGADDLRGYTQCHFFAGIGGWSIALRLAGWDDDRPVWTGSCPCQPFSSSGARKGFADDRHLWPEWLRIIRECRPPVVFGEQVAKATAWLRLVRSDLEALEYAVGCMPIEAASAGADHLRDRLWFVADARSERHKPIAASLHQVPCAGTAALWDRHSLSGGRLQTGDAWIEGYDGKLRRIEPSIRLLADGPAPDVGKLRAFGNAIDPRPAAAFIGAAMMHLDVVGGPCT